MPGENRDDDREREMSARALGREKAPAARPPSALDLLVALVHVSRLPVVVPAALDIVEREPLASAGCFQGDLLRGLMEVPGGFWGRYPTLYERYRRALRSGAATRRRQTYEERMSFWSVLDRETLAELLAERPELGTRMDSPDATTDHPKEGDESCS
jgi:hypothetical protein